jgi:hypothetical protein
MSEIENTSNFPVAMSLWNCRNRESASSRLIDWVRTLIANADINSAAVSREIRTTFPSEFASRSTAGVPISR